jgi:para-aminobenzoate synthetase / 4-amino-4-deoxychorismate lyase
VTERDITYVDDGAPGGGGWLFENPERVVEVWDGAAVEDGLAEVEAAVAAGYHAAGFIAYEAGYAFEPVLAPLMPPLISVGRALPLVRFGLFRDGARLDGEGVRDWLDRRAVGRAAIRDVRPAMDAKRYRAAFERVQAAIVAGDVYQINLTFPLRFQLDGDPLALFADLRRRQPVAFGGCIETPDWTVLSLSPELFLAVDGGRVRARPMKGTAPRGVSPEADRAVKEGLGRDIKSRAENLMIVDLIRNDLSRLAAPGNVRVTDLFTVETHRSVHQMTSGIEAQLRPGVGLVELMKATFPCGSVTGAPKIRAMQIIRDLETAPRGVYTGAIGHIAPDGRMRFNVAIRTLVVDKDGQGCMGIGSGVVYDSSAAAEYDECLIKAAFLTRPDPPFALIETMLWRPAAGYALKERHLERLRASAAYFAIGCDIDRVRRVLADRAAGFGDVATRVRLLLHDDGRLDVEAAPLETLAAVLRFVVADTPAPSDDPFRYHKTTRRALYAAAMERYGPAGGCDEVVFVNERGELTEGTWTNLFVRRDKGGRLVTPPVAAGLLAGTLRAELLATGAAVEGVLRPDDLAMADAVFLGNSVRGLKPATWVRRSA